MKSEPLILLLVGRIPSKISLEGTSKYINTVIYLGFFFSAFFCGRSLRVCNCTMSNMLDTARAHSHSHPDRFAPLTGAVSSPSLSSNSINKMKNPTTATGCITIATTELTTTSSKFPAITESASRRTAHVTPATHSSSAALRGRRRLTGQRRDGFVGLDRTPLLTVVHRTPGSANRVVVAGATRLAHTNRVVGYIDKVGQVCSIRVVQ